MGQVLLHTERSAAPIDPATRQAIAQAVASTEPVFSDFFGPTSGSTQIDVVAAVRDADGQPLAAVVLRSSAEAFLFPMIQDWPLPSHSAETMLVLRAGSDALIPHRLRHQAATAPRWRQPLTLATMPAIQAVFGRQGRFEGLDYRGKAVFADLRAIPESPWFLISKLDRDEALAQLRFEEEFKCELLNEEVSSKVIPHIIRVWKSDGELAAEGRITAACVRKDPATGKMKAIEIPQRFRDKIEAAPHELLKRPEKK